MNSVYMVRNDNDEWLYHDECWRWGCLESAHTFTYKTASRWAKEKGGEVVEFVSRAEMDEVVAALRNLHDFAAPSTHYRHHQVSTEAFAEAAALLKKWEPPA